MVSLLCHCEEGVLPDEAAKRPRFDHYAAEDGGLSLYNYFSYG
jgi:hypothetical protein